MGSAILLSACGNKEKEESESLDRIKTEYSENLSIVMSENGRKSYFFSTPLLEGYMLGRDPYREFCKGISITTYQDDSMTMVNAVLVANYAIYYEKRRLWEAKGNVVVTKHDGTRLYTQQLFWNSVTKRIYSNVDTRLVTDTDELVGEGFESDEEMNEPRFRRWKGKMQIDETDLTESSEETATDKADSTSTAKKITPTKADEAKKSDTPSPAPMKAPARVEKSAPTKLAPAKSVEIEKGVPQSFAKPNMEQP